MIVLRTRSVVETEELGSALARCLEAGDVVLLAGDLGSGKTTLTKGIARGLGVTETVTSPTFTLVKVYECDRPAASKGAGIGRMMHADLFRLDHLKEVSDLGIGELSESDAVAVVEWGDVALSVLGFQSLLVTITHGEDEGERSFTLEPAPALESRRIALESALAPWRSPATR